MNKKQTIDILRHFNWWRRDRNPVNSYEMPDQKKLGIAIDTAIDILESKSKVNESYKKKYEDIQAVLDSSVIELQFANLQIQALYWALDEIVSMTNDPLAKKVAEMAKERHQTDKLIHSRLIFWNK